MPLPSPWLHPNRQPGTRGGRMRKHRITRAYRAAACEAMAAVQVESAPWPTATVALTYYFKTNRKRDLDNLNSWFKAGFDGLADAGIVDDDSAFIPAPPSWEIDKLCPRIEIKITAGEKPSV